jgi:3-dehydroquinate synthase
VAETLTVNLGERSYPIRFGRDLRNEISAAAAGLGAVGRRVAVLTDTNVRRAHGPLLKTMFAGAPMLTVEPGESAKSLTGLGAVLDFLAAEKLDRGGVLFVVGGGVIGDLGGFAAATWLRGIDFLQVPTTLLAMVDASVGGKTAVDTPAGKNTVGAFHPPAAVVIDPATLASLPPRELRSGLAEVIKHGVIADAAAIDEVDAVAPALFGGTPSHHTVEAMIERSVRIKANVVAADERELGLRKVLNFGHTIGHGIEAASGYALLHGEAIAIGMVAEARLAEETSIADRGTALAIERAVSNAGLPSRMPSNIEADRVLALMRSDKKQRRGALEYSLPKRVGEMAGEESGWAVPIPDETALEILRSMS